MKKILAMTLSLILVTGVFAACSNDNNSSSSSETTTSETTTSEETTSETTADDGASAVKTETQKLADVVENSVEWTSMILVEDAERLKDKFGLDSKNPNYEEVTVKEAMMSAAFGEIIVIKAKDGKVDEAVKDLEARKAKMIEQDAFYPDHKELAENAVIGKEGNYAYLIVNEKATDAEKALKAEIAK